MAVLEKFGEFTEENGKFFSPALERGADPNNQTPFINNFPTPGDLRGFNTKRPEDVDKMSRLLGKYGFPPPDEMVEQQQEFLARFNITPDSPQYAAEMERLGSSQSGKVLLSTSRRTQEQYQSLSSVDGNVNTNMVRMEEGGENPPCSLCEPLDGLEMTLAEFYSTGQGPGGSTCEGGDFCLGILVPFE